MTIILKPKCSVKQLNGLTIKLAQTIQRVIKEMYNYELTINDLLLNNKKICGILTEVNSIGEKINYLLISIGFNVNEEYFTKETKEIATSLKMEYNKEFEREKIIISVIENLEKEIEL